MSSTAVAFQGRPTALAACGGARIYRSTYAAGLQLRRHEHDNAHLCFVLSGGYEENVEGRDHERLPGTLLYYPAGAVHSERHFVTGQHLLVEIQPQWTELHRLRRMPGRVLAWSTPSGREPRNSVSLPALSHRLHAAAGAPAVVRTLAVEAALLEICAAILRMSGYRRRAARYLGPNGPASSSTPCDTKRECTGVQPQSTPARDWPEAVREILLGQFRQKLYIADLAVAAGVHPAHLTRGFREQFGCSIGDYVRRLRVLYAVERITKSDESLPKIAADAGFADQCHLTRALREHLDQTPAALRRSRTMNLSDDRRITDPEGKRESASRTNSPEQ